MGSPNFFTDSQFDSFGAVDEDFSSEYDAQDVREAIVEEIEDMNHDLLFHSLELKHGYHEGFQVVISQEQTADSVTRDLLIDAFSAQDDVSSADVYFFNIEGYRCYLDEIPACLIEAPLTLASINIDRDEDGCISDVSITPNEKAVSDMVENDGHRAQHFMAKLAQDYGLRLLIGKTWTSSLTKDPEETQNAINSHYMPDLFEEQEAPAPSAPKMKG